MPSCPRVGCCKRDRFGRDELSAAVQTGRWSRQQVRRAGGNSDVTWRGAARALMHARSSCGTTVGADASRDLGRFTHDQPPAISRARRSATGSWSIGRARRAIASQSVILLTDVLLLLSYAPPRRSGTRLLSPRYRPAAALCQQTSVSQPAACRQQ